MEAFISYRREDSSFAARSLRDRLQWALGVDRVFYDTDSIRSGDNWPERLDKALQGCGVLVAIIGPNWLRASDNFGRRRLDLPDDWVRTEIERALARNIPVIPVRIGGAPLPPPDALPASIAGILDHQDCELSERSWEAGVNQLVDRLVQLGVEPPDGQIRFPTPFDVVPRPLSESETEQKLAEHPGWSLVTSRLPGHGKMRREITKAYLFRSFEEAMQFMSTAAAHISETRYQPWNVVHHPRWENLWRTVTVWLSTWDNGHVITGIDFLMAEYFDRLFESSYANRT